LLLLAVGSRPLGSIPLTLPTRLDRADAAEAGIIEHVHPTCFGTRCWLTAQDLPDSAIQLISGHASKKSLEVYQHLSLAQVEPGYQRAVRQLEI